MLLAYADHNFLIYCEKNKEWQRVVISARDSEIATLVLSPFHLYEFGNVKASHDRDLLLALVEEFRPAWILERQDIQIREFQKEWVEIWTSTPFPPFNAIGSLADAAAALYRTDAKRFENYRVRDFAAEFTREELERVLLPVMKDQERMAATNGEYFKTRKLTLDVMKSIDRRYVAQQLALDEGLIEPKEVQRRINDIMQTQPLATKIEWFVEWCCVDSLKTYQVEKVFTENFYLGKARLNKNRFVDRQHAIGALAHCDVLVTDDGELIEHCERVRQKLKFEVAIVETGEQFISRLKKAGTS